jgi:ComF family protein
MMSGKPVSSGRKALGHLVEELLDILLPRSCAGCGAAGGVVCGQCLEGLAGGALEGQTRTVEAAGRDPAFSDWRAAGAYRGLLKEMVLQLKSSRAAFAAPLAELMIGAAGNDPGYLAPDCVFYVPSDRAKLLARGYNPAEILARVVAGRLSRPLSHAMVKRLRTPDQHWSTGAARLANVEGAYGLEPSAAVRGRVVLIDDVLTTGATADACARLLLSAGATSVGVLVAARSELTRSRP